MTSTAPKNGSSAAPAYLLGIVAIVAMIGWRMLHSSDDVASSTAAYALLSLASFAWLHAFGHWAVARGHSWLSGALPVMLSEAFMASAIFGLK